MSVISVFTRKPPMFGSGESVATFDVVFEDKLNGSVEYTRYPIEAGAMVTDHGIIQPTLWSIKAAVSNNPLFPSLTDFAGGFLSNFFDSGVLAAAGGMSAGFLAGSDSSRAGATLDFLWILMLNRQPFDVDAGDVSLKNMVVIDILRTKNATNENGLEFEAVLMSLPTLETSISNQSPKVDDLPENDTAKTQASGLVEKGEQLAQDVSEAAKSGLNRVFGI